MNVLIPQAKTPRRYNIKTIDEHRFKQSIKPVRLLTLIAGVFNLFLLIPDLINIGRAYAPYVLALRVGFAFLVAIFIFSMKWIKTFHQMSLGVSLLEIIAVVQFLIVLHLYPSPDFMIQLLAFLILLVFILFVPNYWLLSMVIAVAGASAFWLQAAAVFAENTRQLAPGAVYLALLIITGAVCKGYSVRNQRRDILQMARLEQILQTDPLTNSGSRNMLKEIGDGLIEQLARQGRSLALIFMDVDDLKLVNDTYGHQSGDQYLIEIVAIVRGHLRHDDLCVRWGGDEFVLVLPGVILSDAVKLAERIRQTLQAHNFEKSIVPSCSFGVAALKPGQKLESLIEEADQAMYQAKRLGKGRVVVAASAENGGTPCKLL